MSENIYLARQPILDKEGRLYGFELLFRSSSTNSAGVIDNKVATSTVITRTLSEFGVEGVLDTHPGFINCDAQFIMSDEIELLPPDKILLEILETEVATPELIERCKALKTKGYRFVLDDFCSISDTNKDFLPIAHMVKVDIFGMSKPEIFKITSELKKANVILLAEKIETKDEFLFCKDLGFQYFQGYYFSKPEVMKGKRLSTGNMALIRIISIMQKEDASIKEIEEIFKENPNLGVSLLRLANSVANGVLTKVRSISEAIYSLGYKQLERWVLLLLLAEGKQDAKLSLLMRVAATRGKFMELMAPSLDNDSDLKDSAFIVGIVSVMDDFLGMPMDQVVSSLGLSDEMGEALLLRQGVLGTLLCLAEATEYQGDNDAEDVMAISADGMGDTVNRTQGIAIVWANKVLNAV